MYDKIKNPLVNCQLKKEPNRYFGLQNITSEFEN